MTFYSILKTPIDDLVLVASETELTGLYFADCEHVPKAIKEWKLDPKHPVLKQATEQLQEFLKGKRTSFSLPLFAKGTAFQEKVWREIAQIPFGETITYSELAERAGKPKAVRAAGTATGKNPLGIIVPCHRVVGKNGAFGGYAGGLPRKRFLVDLERKLS